MALFNPVVLIQHLWRHRELISQFTKREIEGRYRGSLLGILWSLANPLFMLSIYTFVFGVVLKARWPQARTSSLGEFALIVFCGLTAFNIFGDSVSKAPTLITSVPNYVKKVVFPLEILAVSTIGVAMFHMLISLLVLIGAALLLGFGISATIWLFPVILLPGVLFTLGLVWLLSSLGVFIRDIAPLITIVVQTLFFFTPIFYSLEAIPEPFRTIIQFNPLTFVVESFRLTLIWGQLPDLGLTLAWIVATGAFMMLGYVWFMRTKRAFADVI